MSRALETEVAAALGSGSAEKSYQQISEVFLSPPSGGLLELEILGKSHPFPPNSHVLQDGCAVGVSKLGLVQAFLVARKLLQGHVNGSSPKDDREVLGITAVMLLLDPEHLTAANTRKRLLLKRISSGGDAPELLGTEKYFVDSLLTSRLHRHTKSPTLFSHLQWLLRRFSDHGLAVDVLDDLKKVIFVAGERHPRNYYAWNHARFLIRTFSVENEVILDAVKKWAFQHHTDVSGWTFLHVLLDRSASDPTVIRAAFDEILKLVVSLHLTNETVWVFLRTLTASGLVDEEEYSRFLDTGKNLLESSTAFTDQTVLRAALQWSETYRVKT
ncbi:hypothetical protein QBC47DRAFT_128666 [Echria macrotheca]|uniref:Uncharacterized protein n=1 Tax=Echria macrotheca TaxID=438768 RepID=A0AAJ0F1I0_9PEZI|nr:hypothetical protein QBC47DRAFT_128666 [Echria macrotheca]